MKKILLLCSVGAILASFPVFAMMPGETSLLDDWGSGSDSSGPSSPSSLSDDGEDEEQYAKLREEAAKEREEAGAFLERMEEGADALRENMLEWLSKGDFLQDPAIEGALEKEVVGLPGWKTAGTGGEGGMAFTSFQSVYVLEQIHFARNFRINLQNLENNLCLGYGILRLSDAP